MKTQFFKDKEHYLSFKQAWASAVNDPKAKSKVVLISERIPEWGYMRAKGWIKPYHHILYNLLRDKPLDTGFTPSKEDKAHNGKCTIAFWNALCELDSHIKCAEVAIMTIEDIRMRKFHTNTPDTGRKYAEGAKSRAESHLKKLLEPFNGVLTAHDITKLKLNLDQYR